MNGYAYRPVLAGMWFQREVSDGTYSFWDLLDAHELLDYKEANRQAYRNWVKVHGE